MADVTSSSSTSQWNTDINSNNPNTDDDNNTSEVPYEKQTKLFRLIGRKEFTKALEYLEVHPHEARVWIVTKYATGTTTTTITANNTCNNENEMTAGMVESNDKTSSAPPHQQPEPKEKYWYKRLPLHHACERAQPHNNDDSSSYEILIEKLIQLYPQAIVLGDENQKVPLIHACIRNGTIGQDGGGNSSNTTGDGGFFPKLLHYNAFNNINGDGDDHEKKKGKLIMNDDPTQCPDEEGKYALHWACEYSTSYHLIQMLLDATNSKSSNDNADVVKLQDKAHGRLPLHWECSTIVDRRRRPESSSPKDGNHKNDVTLCLDVFEALIELYPEGLKVQDLDGNTPLELIDDEEIKAAIMTLLVDKLNIVL